MQAEPLYPLLLESKPVERPWGDSRIALRFNRSIGMARCGESWEVSARPEAPARILNGSLAGLTLTQAWARLGFGRSEAPSRFPLLIKLLDANEKLSVQVHPGAAAGSPPSSPAEARTAEPKTEMWHVLEADACACVYAGLTPGTTRGGFQEAIRTGTVANCLRKLPVRSGQTLFIPGGCVHAIGAGCLIYEVQQNSDTTYRVYDWDRVDARGQRRELHIDAALRVMDWRTPAPLPLEAPNLQSDCWPTPLVECPWFRFRLLQVARGLTIPADQQDVLTAVFSLRGAAILDQSGTSVRLEPGRSALMPLFGQASCRIAAAEPDNPATLLLTQG